MTVLPVEIKPFAEAAMLTCWGVSWPFSVIKTLRVKKVTGKSARFLWFVICGYLAGIVFKLSSGLDYVLAFYVFNLAVVGLDTALYYRYRANG